MKTTPVIPYKEDRHHGTADFPCAYYQLDYLSPHLESSFVVKHHWHEEIEIIYFQKGTYHLEINMDKYEIDAECFCFVNSEELHSLSSDHDFQEKALIFSASMLAFAVKDPAQSQFIQPLIDRTLTLPRFILPSDSCFSAIKEIFLQISHVFNTSGDFISWGRQHSTSDPVRQLLIKAGLLQLLATLAQSRILYPAAVVSDRRIEMVKKVITYMNQHYKEKIYICDLASEINMNEQYLCRFFKKIIGKSPITYLNDIRIKQAARLLLETDAPVMTICLECGFNNLGNFMRIFKNTHGLTPLQYRKVKIT